MTKEKIHFGMIRSCHFLGWLRVTTSNLPETTTPVLNDLGNAYPLPSAAVYQSTLVFAGKSRVY